MSLDSVKKLPLFIEKQLADFNDLSFIRLLKIFCFISSAILLYAAIFSGFQIVDEFEHLHASWLVSEGFIPYKDFFEHHHPLLWYLSAPIVSLFYNNVTIFYVMRLVSCLVSVATLFYMCQIVLFFSNKTGVWLTIALYLGNIITFYNFYQYRPDVYMNFCFILGLFYWLKHLKTNLLKYLIFAFLSFSFSILFLQKISLLILFAEFIMIALCFSKRMKLKDITVAAIPSFGVFLIFLFFLYKSNSLLAYFELNYRFNQALIYYFERGSFWYPSVLYTIYPLTLVCAFYFFKKENIYFKIIALIFGAELLMRCFYFSPHPNYYTLLTMLTAIVLSVTTKYLMPRRRLLTAVIIVLMFLNLGRLFNTLEFSINRHNSYEHYKLSQYVHNHSDKNDLLMNGYDMNFNVYRLDVSYYWFGLDMLLPVMESEYNLSQKPDINALIIQYKPKFIYTRDYLDLRAYRTYGEKRYSQQFIPEIVQMLYKKAPFNYLAELK